MIKHALILSATALVAISAQAAYTTVATWNDFSSSSNGFSFVNATNYLTGTNSLDFSKAVAARNGTNDVAGANQTYVNLQPAGISTTGGSTSFAVALNVSNLSAGVNTLFSLSAKPAGAAYGGLFGLSIDTTNGTLNFGNFTAISSKTIANWSTRYTAGQELSVVFYRTAGGAISAAIGGLVGGPEIITSGIINATYKDTTLSNLYLGTSVSTAAANYATNNTTNFVVDNNFSISSAAIYTGDMTNAELLNISTAIPEPSTYGLIGAGALGAVALVRRRRKTVA